MDYQGSLRLDGRGFVVLGAGQGIGLATTKALAGQGASILCVDRDEALAKAAADEIGGHFEVADVTEEAALERVFARAASLYGDSLSGMVDIVGMADLRAIDQFTQEQWDRQFNLIVRHEFFAFKHASLKFGARGGTMVCISSVAGIRSFEGQAVYGAAKAAMNHLVGTAAVEMGPRNIRVNAVAPGLTVTPRLSGALGADRLRELSEHVPLRRLGAPEDIAAAVLFLSSELSRQITGVVLSVDGGLANHGAFPPLNVGAKLLKPSAS
jgi:NAD(P)-dependent dehydrogenase (short-subunit alcohol dehydrogenase family)